ncbi:oligosaccharide flippase family protein [Clostridium sp.]|uniref:oligosaccharide flippase family protein n=1 Tax=Clostridium sp. TaxID=1506 RepID=UPI002910E724|nr:oligosaccharide flippase family protein [Clostridium sp.]MDU5108193.1 oligosaccharide flippase family protein [Clostridium sp.]
MNKLFKKFMEFAIGNGLTMIVGLLSTIIVSRMILPYEKGRADIFITYTSLMVLILTMGIDQAYVRYFNEENENSRGKLLRNSVKIPIILNLIFSIIILIFYKIISKYMVGEISFLLIVLFAIHSFFSIINNFAMMNVRMKQKAKTYSILGITNKAAFIMLIVILYYMFKDNYITLVLATVLANIIATLLAIFIEREDWLNFDNSYELNTTTKDLVRYGSPFIFSMAITWIFQSIDRISIQLLSNYTELGLYGGAMNIIAILNAVQWAFTTFWVPVAYDKYSKEPEDVSFFSNISEIVSFVMFICAIILIATKDVLIMILGKGYEGAQFIFPFLVLMPIMYTISETTVLGVNFKEKTKYHVYIASFSAIFNILGNFILVPKYGARGAAISTGLAYVIFFISRTYYGNKLYKIKLSPGKFCVSAILVYALAAYSSVYKFNYVILILSIVSISLILYMYRKTIKILIKSIINKDNSFMDKI